MGWFVHPGRINKVQNKPRGLREPLAQSIFPKQLTKRVKSESLVVGKKSGLSSPRKKCSSTILTNTVPETPGENVIKSFHACFPCNFEGTFLGASFGEVLAADQPAAGPGIPALIEAAVHHPLLRAPDTPAGGSAAMARAFVARSSSMAWGIESSQWNAIRTASSVGVKIIEFVDSCHHVDCT